MNAEQSEATILVGPVAQATGRLVDQIGKPVMQGYIRYGIRIPEDDPMAAFTQFPWGAAIFDSEGNFRLTGLVLGETYMLMYVPPRESAQVGMPTLANIQPTTAGNLRLGKIVYRPRDAVASPAMPSGDELERVLQRQQQLSDFTDQIADGIGRDFVVRALRE